MKAGSTRASQQSDASQSSISSLQTGLACESRGGRMTIAAGQRFHFIGAGGIGMSGLAKLLLKHNCVVTASDQSRSPVTEGLAELGVEMRIGHNEQNLDDQKRIVVISAAIKEDNPELKLARKRGCRIYKYAQMLGLLMNDYEGVAVAGTHGKSTTSGWLVFTLKQLGFDVNFIIGADISQLGTNSGAGNSEIFVAEACEYDRSFLNLRPKIGCILNIEADHLDYYRDEAEIVEAFAGFAGGIKEDGVLIANGSDKNVRKILDSRQVENFQTIGFERSCDFYAENLRLKDGLYSFDVYNNGNFLGNAQISVPGKHNVFNALAVVAMAVNLGQDGSQVVASLGKFTGMDRRIMERGRINSVTILDDYAHHPTEVRASLEAIRQRYQPRRLWCVFQPHQYSRTRFLLDDFAESFKLADITIVLEIYFVRDSVESKKEVNAAMLAEKIRMKGSNALFIDGFERICDYLVENVSIGDVVVTMGAGDVWKVADEYIQRLGKNSKK
jgi:UDP-N-acetylmuramate--alanine ligase